MTDKLYIDLIEAVKNGDLQEVRRCLEQEADPNGIIPCGSCGFAMLHVAVGTTDRKPPSTRWQDKIEVLKCLISFGADIHDGRNLGHTPLHCASAYNQNTNVEILEYLLSQGADLHAIDCEGWTPLHHATWGSSIETIQFLISQGADLYAQDSTRRTPLDVFAFGKEEKEVVFQKEIESRRASLASDMKKPSFENIFDAAKAGVIPDVASFFRDYGDFLAAIIATDETGATPLHIVAGFNPNASALKYMGAWLMSFGEESHINVKDHNSKTPLHYAASNPNIEALKYLVSQHANVHVRDRDGKTPLDVADTEEKKRILREAMAKQ